MADVDDQTPLVQQDEGHGGLVRETLMDKLLDRTGYGFFHVLLVLVSGWALASDSVEVQSISFVVPVIDDSPSNDSFHPSSVEEGALDSIIFLGMMVGGYVWGSWADVAGRRTCLITSLVVNGLFGFTSSLSPNFPLFLFFRFMSGVGVGGSLPVAFSYFSEFFSTKHRNRLIIILAAFWMVGMLFASLLAWVVIPTGVSFTLGSLEVASWRIFLMLCTFPSLSAAFLLVFMPESPSFLYTKKKYSRLQRALKTVSSCHRRKMEVTLEIYTQAADVDGNNSESLGAMNALLQKLKLLLSSTVELFRPPMLRPSLVSLIIWFTFSFGYYGLVLWFPKYFQYVQEQDYNCSGPDAGSPACNSSNDRLYLDSVYVALSGVPGTVLGVLLINAMGSRIILAVSMVISALSTFVIWGITPSENSTVVLSCVFNGVSIAGWSALDVLLVELFPVHLRGTAFGLLAANGRIGAIIGTVLFGKLITVSVYLPILIVATLILAGGLSVFLLPWGGRLPPLLRGLRLCCRRLRRCL